MSRVSVVIPCVGQADLIDVAIRSCLRQSFLREVIIVDDGVSNESRTELEQIAAATPCIKLIRTAKRNGAGVARNLGAKQAGGEYICFLDPSDELLSDYFSQVVSLLDARPEFAAIKVGIQFLDQYGSPVILPGDPRYTALLSSVSGNLILRRIAFERMGGFSEDIRFSGELAGEEAAFSRAVEQYLVPLGFMPEAFYRRNARPGSPLLKFVGNTRVVNENVFQLLSVFPEQAADGLLGQAIDDYLKQVGERVSFR